MADYISVENQKALGQVYGTGVKLGLLMALSAVVFMFIARLISPEGLPGSERFRPVYVAVIVLGVIVIAIRRLLMSQTILSKVAPRGVNALLSRMLMTTIICLAIGNLVAIMGLTFYLLTGDYEYSWRLGAISILLVLYSFPRRKEWERIISRNTQ
jgi:hypothetical protein